MRRLEELGVRLVASNLHSLEIYLFWFFQLATFFLRGGSKNLEFAWSPPIKNSMAKLCPLTKDRETTFCLEGPALINQCNKSHILSNKCILCMQRKFLGWAKAPRPPGISVLAFNTWVQPKQSYSNNCCFLHEG